MMQFFQELQNKKDRYTSADLLTYLLDDQL